MLSAPHRFRLVLSGWVVATLLGGGLFSGWAAEAHQDPWALLDTLRDHLGSAPQQADFVQEFRPAGFSSPDRESGHLFLSLPECLRWDYLDPFPKTFLLCGDQVHTWDPGDQAGRRFDFSEREEPGIDLLRLQTEDLESRYDAQLEKIPAGGWRVSLTPRQEQAVIARALLTIDAEAELLLELYYEDQEGNRSSFSISGYRPLEDDRVFQVPQDLEWMD